MAVKAECEEIELFSEKVENINKDIEIHERYIDKSGINEIIALLEEKKQTRKFRLWIHCRTKYFLTQLKEIKK